MHERPHGVLESNPPERAQDLEGTVVVVLAAVLPPFDEDRAGVRVAGFAQRERGSPSPRDVLVGEQLGRQRCRLTEPRQRERRKTPDDGILVASECQGQRRDRLLAP
jgi:hypothetical protein